MTSKLHHYIHLNLKDIRLSDIKSCENPLDLLNNVINNDNYEQFITFSQNADVVWNAFNKIVCELPRPTQSLEVMASWE